MEVILVLLATILPPICWIAVCYWWDRGEPEPKLLTAKLFLSGMLMGFFIAGALMLFQVIFVTSGTFLPFNALSEKDSLASFFIASAFVAVTHTYITLVLARKLVAKERSFSQVVDGIVYFSIIALGAGLTENILFCINYFSTTNEPKESIPFLIFSLIFKSVLLGVSAGIVGFAFGNIYKRALEDGRIEKWELKTSWKNPEIMEGLAVAILLHTAYQVFIYLKEPRIAGIIVIVGFFYIFSRFSIRALTTNIQE
ncbi:MAG: PrsW family glutamic-type intramembrane protease [bacterium]|nr:PrsW family glutamic-type intramembrane protease [bacterium]